MLQIAVINESTAISDGKVQEMLPAFEQQWNQDLDPVWGVGSAKFTFVPNNQPPRLVRGGSCSSTTATRPALSPITT